MSKIKMLTAKTSSCALMIYKSVKCVRILSIDGDCVSYITHQGAGAPRYLCVNGDRSRIYYTGGLDNDVFINCITRDGFGIFSVSSSDLQSTSSAVTDKDGNILVVDDKAKCLQIVSAGGVFDKKVIVENKTMSEPISCCLNSNEELILVSFWQTQSRVVYTLCSYRFHRARIFAHIVSERSTKSASKTLLIV